MQYLDLTFNTPEENLACDEALLDLLEEGGHDEDILRFWEPEEPFVVLGRSRPAAVEVILETCDHLKIPVLRRISGGGTVLQGPGCLNYALILHISPNAPFGTIASTNLTIIETNRNALAADLEIHSEMAGDTDLAIKNLKFSGNSQRRKKKCLLFHGTFLCHFHIPLIEEVLTMPQRQPAYRQHRPHTEFLTNLRVPTHRIKASLKGHWHADHPLKNIPKDRISRLVAEKYGNDQWNMKF
ncbi:MAG: lipoate--protein ligase family protein [Candidatus Omnitrophota bacterium]|nr:lipoate--protein ligase family protein [Candidatus Omnitrophota bacterium]